MRTTTLLLAASLALTACGEPVRDDHYTNQVEPAPPPTSRPVEQKRAVRIGELGPSFAACATAGTTRNLKAGETLPVRAAPFDSAAETGGVPAGGRFYVCARSLDQKWLGVVYDDSGALADSCGVSEPATIKRDYQGPCRSGWVASPFVRLVAGVEQPPVANPPPPAAPMGAGKAAAQ
jgi:hypothetical protein